MSAGALPHTPVGELIALPNLLRGFKGPACKEGEGKGGKWERGREENREGEETRGKGRGRTGPQGLVHTPCPKS